MFIVFCCFQCWNSKDWFRVKRMEEKDYRQRDVEQVFLGKLNQVIFLFFLEGISVKKKGKNDNYDSYIIVRIGYKLDYINLVNVYIIQI